MGPTQVHWYGLLQAKLASIARLSEVGVRIETDHDMFLQYTAAVKTSALDSTSKSLAALSEVFKREARLNIILAAPTLTPSDKSQIIQELQRHMGGLDKGDTVKNFLQTLANNNRLNILDGVCEKFSTLMVAARGEIDLVITSAQVR